MAAQVTLTEPEVRAFSSLLSRVSDRLATYEEPPMDPSIREELDAFVAKRRAEGGAPTDF